ncbi:glycosyltransferase family 2 protein [Salinibacter ruber]|uniref:glycosyltransferase family 2 protein n=1 Tax=Salinibacter ruber TaxID=146919 RepID=UPI00216902BB|nr:glycosyltransferase family 2 protein [Salinibacter ruber]MCS4198118.1 glycosyltransferase involved in cell wall biosynthesis [Salinibacter ruber]
MKVSIVTVSYNSAQTISDTIESVRRQTYPHIEYIVVDGGSTDETVEIITKNEEVIDRWTSEPDEGIYDAMNKGIRMSSGDIVGILNSDDWYEPKAVETAVRVFEKHEDVDLVHGAMRLWKQEGKVDGCWGKRDGLPPTHIAPFNHPTLFVRRKVYRNIGLFDVSLPTAADYDFMLRFMKSGYEEKYVDHVLTNFRQGGVTSQRLGSPLGQIWRVLRQNGYSPYAVMKGLTFRVFRDVVAWMLNRLGSRKAKSYIRRYLPYRAEVESTQ